MKLSMLYATYEDRFNSLLDKIPEAHPDTEIIIIHQTYTPDNYLEDVKKFDARPDIKYISQSNTGVTKSRNLAIENSTGDILLFCDDDVIYEDNFQKTIINSFMNNNVGFITFAYKHTSDSLWPEKFSSIKYNHSLYTILSVGTIQIACLKKYVLEFNIKFPEDMGAGSNYFLCDEPVFLSQFIKNKISGIYEPYVICLHPEESSGDIFNDFNAFYSRYLCFTRIFGKFNGRFIYLAYIMKNLKKFNSIKNFFISLKALI
ncbi:glycosyltransferase family 2 protein [Providencia rettgeri]